MSANRVPLEGYDSPERNRYRLLLEITDVVARAENLPAAF
jgi:hypothetical protein